MCARGGGLQKSSRRKSSHVAIANGAAEGAKASKRPPKTKDGKDGPTPEESGPEWAQLAGKEVEVQTQRNTWCVDRPPPLRKSLVAPACIPPRKVILRGVSRV